MFDNKYLSQDHLDGFGNYKYMAIDTSPLSRYVMHPFWNKVVEFVPNWVAPNLLTFAGFLLIVLDFILISIYDYNYYAASLPNVNSTDNPIMHNGYNGTIPPWLWIAAGLFLFLAYTLDGIDGKQARKTQTSGPLGELFDHGLDSYTVFFIPVCLYSVFGRQDYSIPPIRFYFLLWNILLNFYLSHWEKYNTGVLFLPWGYDFSMWGSTLIFLVAGIKGTSFFKAHVTEKILIADVFEILTYATGLLTNLPVAVYNTYQSYKLRTGKMRTFWEAIRPLWSLLAVFTITTYWICKSPNNIVEYDPRITYLMVGTLFSNVSCRLIVSQMSNQRCEAICWLVWLLGIAAATSLFIPRLEIASLYLFTAITVYAHVHYGTYVVRQMCDHFRINCFQTKKRTD